MILDSVQLRPARCGSERPGDRRLLLAEWGSMRERGPWRLAPHLHRGPRGGAGPRLVLHLPLPNELRRRCRVRADFHGFGLRADELRRPRSRSRNPDPRRGGGLGNGRRCPCLERRGVRRGRGRLKRTTPTLGRACELSRATGPWPGSRVRSDLENPMRPRYAADYRTLLWLAAMHVVAFAPYVEPRLVPWLLPVSLYFGFCAGVFSHNHNHCPTFKSRRPTPFYAAWLSIFYGFPTFAWIPTHNLNHHKYVNKAGDATITWRYSKKNTWLDREHVLLRLGVLAVGPDQGVHRARRAPRTARSTGRSSCSTRRWWARRWGSWRWPSRCTARQRGARSSTSSGSAIPALFANWSMIFINYIQHVHADPWSEHNHSRNFVSKLGNLLVFNNGYHTAHHESAGAALEQAAGGARQDRGPDRSRAEAAEHLRLLSQGLPPRRAQRPVPHPQVGRPRSTRRTAPKSASTPTTSAPPKRKRTPSPSDRRSLRS